MIKPLGSIVSFCFWVCVFSPFWFNFAFVFLDIYIGKGHNYKTRDLLIFTLYWRVTGLCGVGFCPTAMGISRRHARAPPSWASRPPPAPSRSSGWHRVRAGLPASQQLPPLSVSHVAICVFWSHSRKPSHYPVLPHWVHKSSNKVSRGKSSCHSCSLSCIPVPIIICFGGLWFPLQFFDIRKHVPEYIWIYFSLFSLLEKRESITYISVPQLHAPKNSSLSVSVETLLPF